MRVEGSDKPGPKPGGLSMRSRGCGLVAGAGGGGLGEGLGEEGAVLEGGAELSCVRVHLIRTRV